MLSHETIRGYLDQIFEIITSKLYKYKSSTPKIIWNLCVAIQKIIDTYNALYGVTGEDAYNIINYEESYLLKIFCFKTTDCFLDVFMNGQNYKTKIHACQTLLKYRNLSQYGFLDDDRNPQNLLKTLWMHIQEQLKFQINFNQA